MRSELSRSLPARWAWARLWWARSPSFLWARRWCSSRRSTSSSQALPRCNAHMIDCMSAYAVSKIPVWESLRVFPKRKKRKGPVSCRNPMVRVPPLIQTHPSGHHKRQAAAKRKRHASAVKSLETERPRLTTGGHHHEVHREGRHLHREEGMRHPRHPRQNRATVPLQSVSFSIVAFLLDLVSGGLSF